MKTETARNNGHGKNLPAKTPKRITFNLDDLPEDLVRDYRELAKETGEPLEVLLQTALKRGIPALAAMETAKATISLSELAEFHLRVPARRGQTRAIQENLFRWSESQGKESLYDHRLLQFEARTSLASDDVIETLYWCPESKEFYLLRNYRLGVDLGETGKFLTHDEAIRWSIDRLMGPKTAEFAAEAFQVEAR